MTHFYMHLPSNSSESFFPDNTMAQYVTRLMNRVELEGDWEVGLSEILFTKSWHNLGRNEYMTIEFPEASGGKDGYRPVKWRYKVRICEGYYNNADELVNEINNSIHQIRDSNDNKGRFRRALQRRNSAEMWRSNIRPSIRDEFHPIEASPPTPAAPTSPTPPVREGRKRRGSIDNNEPKTSRMSQLVNTDITTNQHPKDSWPVFNYKTQNNKVTATLKPGVRVFMSAGLKEILGFVEENAVTTIKGAERLAQTVVESVRGVDLNSRLQAFYVYCDIVDSVRLGDTECPLLRIVDTGIELNGTLVRRHYLAPVYVPVRRKNFEHIGIKLLTDSGKPVPFQTGRVILTLHFKKSDKNYFV